MAFKYKEPQRCDYDTEEEYEEAIEIYESALDDYCDRYEESRHDD